LFMAPFPALERSAKGGVRLLVTPDWCQGRTAFGGLLATAAVRAAGELVDPARRLRSAVVAFVAPVSAGAVDIEVTSLREGSAMSFVAAHVLQTNRICTTVTATFGLERDGLRIAPPQRPLAPSPESLPPIPFIPGYTPEFTRHFDYRWTSPVAPYSGADSAHVQGWILARDVGPADAALLFSLIDAWPPPIVSRIDRPVPLSSVTWLVNLLGPPIEAPSDAWWFFDSQSHAAGHGYSDALGRLWGPDGKLAATSHQLVADFSAPA